jgi:hypothetical protein
MMGNWVSAHYETFGNWVAVVTMALNTSDVI